MGSAWSEPTAAQNQTRAQLPQRPPRSARNGVGWLGSAPSLLSLQSACAGHLPATKRVARLRRKPSSHRLLAPLTVLGLQSPLVALASPSHLKLVTAGLSCTTAKPCPSQLPRGWRSERCERQLPQDCGDGSRMAGRGESLQAGRPCPRALPLQLDL